MASSNRHPISLQLLGAAPPESTDGSSALIVEVEARCECGCRSATRARLVPDRALARGLPPSAVASLLRRRKWAQSGVVVLDHSQAQQYLARFSRDEGGKRRHVVVRANLMLLRDAVSVLNEYGWRESAPSRGVPPRDDQVWFMYRGGGGSRVNLELCDWEGRQQLSPGLGEAHVPVERVREICRDL